MLVDNGILIAIVGAASSLGTVIIQKAFSRKKDAVEIQSQIIQDLYKELARLRVEVEQLQKERIIAATREDELQTRVEELEADNKKQAAQIGNQAAEIKRLKEELQNVRPK